MVSRFFSRCERPYVKGCNSGASQKISWEQLVTCLAHCKEHSETSLAEYWGRWGCTVGQVTSRTISFTFVLSFCLQQLSCNPVSPCESLYLELFIQCLQNVSCPQDIVLSTHSPDF